MIDTSLAAYRWDLAIKGYSPKTQKPWELDGIPRVEKHTHLPPILSKEAIAVIRHAANVKHRVMLRACVGLDCTIKGGGSL